MCDRERERERERERTRRGGERRTRVGEYVLSSLHAIRTMTVSGVTTGATRVVRESWREREEEREKESERVRGGVRGRDVEHILISLWGGFEL